MESKHSLSWARNFPIISLNKAPFQCWLPDYMGENTQQAWFKINEAIFLVWHGEVKNQSRKWYLCFIYIKMCGLACVIRIFCHQMSIYTIDWVLAKDKKNEAGFIFLTRSVHRITAFWNLNIEYWGEKQEYCYFEIWILQYCNPCSSALILLIFSNNRYVKEVPICIYCWWPNISSISFIVWWCYIGQHVIGGKIREHVKIKEDKSNL